MSNRDFPIELLSEIYEEDLYVKLIEQLNKDFQLSGIESHFDLELNPNSLIHQLEKSILDLINTNFDGYLNLLYRVDISELELKKLDGSNIEKLSEQVVYLLLKRVWKKVWFKNKL